MIEQVPIGQTAQNVKPGDFILCHRKGFASAAIRLGERIRFKRGLVSHAAFCEDSTTLIEALTHAVVRTPLTAYDHIEYWIVRMHLHPVDQDQIVTFAMSCVGQHYGFLTDLGIALRFLTPGSGLWFGMNGTEICSGLVAQAMVRGWDNFPVNPAAMSPQELYDYYDPSCAKLGA